LPQLFDCGMLWYQIGYINVCLSVSIYIYKKIAILYKKKTLSECVKLGVKNGGFERPKLRNLHTLAFFYIKK